MSGVMPRLRWRDLDPRSSGSGISRGALYNPKGLSVHEVAQYLEKNKTLEGYPKAEFMTNAELLLNPARS